MKKNLSGWFDAVTARWFGALEWGRLASVSSRYAADHRGQGMVEYEMLFKVFRLPSCVIPLLSLLLGEPISEEYAGPKESRNKGEGVVLNGPFIDSPEWGSVGGDRRSGERERVQQSWKQGGAGSSEARRVV